MLSFYKASATVSKPLKRGVDNNWLTIVGGMNIVNYMKVISMAEAKPNIANLIDSAEQSQERIVITKDGEPAAILLGIEDFEDMNNLIEIFTDPALQIEILDDIAYSKAHPDESVSAEELRRVLSERWNSGKSKN